MPITLSAYSSRMELLCVLLAVTCRLSDSKGITGTDDGHIVVVSDSASL